jgi:hypothetical protein
MFQNFEQSFDASQEVSDSLYELVNDDERKKYVCKQKGCGKFFRYKSEIIRHAATHSESRPFICQYDNCFKAFKRNDALENHIRSSHTKETPFICPFPDCGMKFTTHGSFRYHVLKHNRQNPESQIPLHHLNESLEEVVEPRKQIKVSSPSTSVSSNPPVSLKVDPIYNKLGFPEGSEEFFAPPPRFAASTLKWEFLDDDAEVEAQVPQTEEAQKTQLNLVLEENQVLKQKLATSEKVIKSMQKQINDLLGSLFAYQTQLGGAQNGLALSKGSSMIEQPQQDNFVSQNDKVEEPILDMINYETDVGQINQPEIYNTNMENNSLDSFFSFGKELSYVEF